ncbi:EAL domain-containing protein [Robertmurraya korlensis]|uniref:putative bifunctional diguanylate cyclase/phosphodiesterase n=1 Tax=Robertmurraya korlensis TaxID=519977 RepID=UPI0020404880|nr:EAL domain-containing protein [Robertmurraya korlensis]MCM3601876.1 EAL domain-containing protein [Robertmurraya korlensis]
MKANHQKSIGVFIFLYILLYYFVVVFGDPSIRLIVVMRNIISTFGPLISSIWLLSRFLKGEEKRDYFSLYLSLGTFSYFIAEILWMYYESYLFVNVPYPGSPDIFYMLQIMFYLIALGYYFYQVKTIHRLMRWIFEVLIIMISATTLSYHFIMKSLIVNPEITGAYLLVSLGYPIGDLILLFSALILYFDSDDFGKRNALFYILVGLVFQVFADSGYVYLTLREKYETGTLFDPLFTLALLLVGFSSFYMKPVNKQHSDTVRPSKVGLWRLIILYTSLMALLLIFYKIEEIKFTPFTLSTMFIIFLILVRLVFILVENNRLLLKYDQNNKDLLLSTERYMSLFKYHPDAVFSLRLNGTFQSANASCAQLVGMETVQLIGKSIYQFINPRDLDRFATHFSKIEEEPQVFEVNLNSENGSAYSVVITLVPIIIKGKIEGIYGIGKDITEVKVSLDRINYMAFHDLLTGLPNRALFESVLNTEIKDGTTENRRLAVMYIDLDRFKNINDTLGHDAGDELLVEMAKRLSDCVGDQAIIGRQGGDEFTLLFNHIVDRDHVVTLAESVCRVLSEPYSIRNYEFLATPSMGISIFEPGKSETAISLMKKADLAMYKAKNNGRNQFRIFEPKMEEDSRSTFVLGSDLSKAVQNNELVLHYQPQYDTDENRMYGVEALIRWQHPTFGLLYPGDFISIAEDTDLIIPIGEWILRETCKQGKLWGEQLRVSVNISPKQFQSVHLIETIKRALEETKFRPDLLNIEITEAVAMSNMNETLKKLEAIRNLGVNLSIDDFGTGYSSLSYLPKLPISELKIPREFLVEMEHHTAYKAIIQSIIALGKRLRVDVIAEGVETQKQKEMLEKMKCHMMQGYHFSRPVPVDEIEKMLYVES